MPSNRPHRYDASARGKTRPPAKTRQPRRPRSTKPSGSGDDSALLYWIAVGLIVVIAGLLIVLAKTDEIKTWYAGPEAKPKPKPAVASTTSSSHPQTPPKPSTSVPKTLREKAAEETRLLVERDTPPPAVPPAPAPVKPAPPATPLAVQPPPAPEKPPVAPPPVQPPPQPIKPTPPPAPIAVQPPPPPTPPPAVAATPELPPLVQPVPAGQVPGAPPRALPLDPNKLDTERIAAFQVALERIHFSCGFIDGNQGMRTQRMLRAFQASRGLPITGVLDQPTRDSIGEPGEPFLTYTVTADDVASIMPKPETWLEKSKVPRLGYNDIWEMLAEKFHCTRAYLKDLNHGVKIPVAGTELIGPKVYPASSLPKATSLRILLSETSIEALDAGGKVIAFFPCSIAKDKNKRPNGALVVKSVVPNPDYTFDPALFADAAKAEGLTKKMVLPPGPRNPVGTTWIGLSLPGYGIHGTPEPENISRTQSHGCFRLANWNADKVLKMVKVGTPVDVQP